MEEVLFSVKTQHLALHIFNTKMDLDMRPVEKGLIGFQLIYLNDSDTWETGENFMVASLSQVPTTDLKIAELANFINEIIFPFIDDCYRSNNLEEAFRKLEYFSTDWYVQLPTYFKEEWAGIL